MILMVMRWNLRDRLSCRDEILSERGIQVNRPPLYQSVQYRYYAKNSEQQYSI